MNRSDIHLLIDKGLLTVGHVRHVLDMASRVDDLSKPSRVNPSLTKMIALGIFQAGAFIGRDDTDIVGARHFKANGEPAYTERGDRLTAVNILREFGDVDGASLGPLIEQALYPPKKQNLDCSQQARDVLDFHHGGIDWASDK